MVTDLLVDTRLVEDGRKLVTGLVRDGLDVAVAFWVLRAERVPWYLYIASPQVIPGHLGNMPLRVYDQLRRMPNSAVEFSQVRLIPASEPAARDAIATRDRPPLRLTTDYRFRRV
jgi:hypothetical protein